MSKYLEVNNCFLIKIEDFKDIIIKKPHFAKVSILIYQENCLHSIMNKRNNTYTNAVFLLNPNWGI